MPKKKMKSVGSKVKDAGLIAAAAGWYFLYASPAAKKNRKKMKGWMIKARGEVIEAFEKHKNEIDREKYDAIIDKVSGRYKKLSSVSGGELRELQRELKKHWNVISKEAGPEKRAVKRTARKAVRKTKKAVQKGKKTLRRATRK